MLLCLNIQTEQDTEKRGWRKWRSERERTNRDRKSSCLCLALQILTEPHGPDTTEACFRHGMKNKKGNCLFFILHFRLFFLGFVRYELRILTFLCGIVPSQRPAPLRYCCYVWQAMVLSRHTSCSHVVKNISRSKEETDNALMDKTEQVTLGMKQSLHLQILSFFKKLIINTVLWLFNVSGQIVVAPQFKWHVNDHLFFLY